MPAQIYNAFFPYISTACFKALEETEQMKGPKVKAPLI